MPLSEGSCRHIRRSEILSEMTGSLLDVTSESIYLSRIQSHFCIKCNLIRALLALRRQACHQDIRARRVQWCRAMLWPDKKPDR